MISLVFSAMGPVVADTEQLVQSAVETFDNLTDISGSTYVDGSFTGNNGVTWSYYASRDEGSYGIDGDGLMLRNQDAGSKIVSNPIPAGISSFSVDLKKAFTGAGNRQVELFINGQSYGVSEAFDDTNTYTFTVSNIDVAGDVMIEIRNVSKKQIVIDNISWTSFSGEVTQVSPIQADPPSGAVESGAEVTLYSSTVGAAVYYTMDGSDPSDMGQLFTTPIVIEDEVEIKAIGLKEGLDASEVSSFTYTIKKPLEVISIADARLSDENSEVKIEGIVTATFDVSGATNVYVQDETAAIVLRGKDLNLSIGDQIQAVGTLKSFFGMEQLSTEPSQVTFIQNGSAPDAVVITSTDLSVATGELVEGELVQVNEVTIDSVDNFGNVIASDANGTLKLRPEQTSLLEIGQTYESIKGVVEYNFNEYKIVPRSLDDIVGGGSGGDPIEGLNIHHIQGASHTSPYVDQLVKEVPGIVTFITGSGFYMESMQSDSDERTSEGIYVFKKDASVNIGDEVLVDGKVTEFKEGGFPDANDLLTTQLIGFNVSVQSTGNELPAAITLGEDRIVPTKIIDNDGFAAFDPAEDGIDFYESLEGMRIVIPSATVVAPTKYDEIAVINEGSVDADRTSFGGILISEQDYNPEKMLIDVDGFGDIQAKVGDTFTAPITAVVGYNYSNYKFIPTSLPTLNDGGAVQEVTTIEKNDEQLTIAAYNVENFSATTKQAKIDGIAQSIVSHLQAPDIIGLVEVQDNDGKNDSGVSDASESYQALVNAIEAAGGPSYSYVDIAPEDKQDGGQPGGNIRVGFIYNEDRVSLMEKEKGDATTAVSYDENGLTLNPGRIDPTNEAFAESRKSLAAAFDFQGEEVIVIANHFNSKRGDDALFGSKQPVELGSETQRLAMANVVNTFIQQVQDVNEDANIVVLGDLNDFEFSNPLNVLKGEQLTNMIDLLPKEERYTYIYQGNAQVLDHVLVSNNLADQAQVDVVNINTPFGEDNGGVSDHDPVLVQLDLTSKQDTSLSILQHNVYFLENTLVWWKQGLRANYMLDSQYIQQHDVVILNELYDNYNSNTFLKQLKDQYPYQTKVLGRSMRGWDETTGNYSIFAQEDGGVSIVSKYPIEEKVQHIFTVECGTEKRTSKGFVYAKINKDGQYYHVIGTQLQQSDKGCWFSDAEEIRAAQMEEIRSFIDERQIPLEEVVFIGGDFGVDRSNTQEYNNMVETLEVNSPDFTGHEFTYDPTTNGIAGKNEPRAEGKYVDYIFVERNHAQLDDWTNDVMKVKSPTWKYWFKQYNDYSDHYPVAGYTQ